MKLSRLWGLAPFLLALAGPLPAQVLRDPTQAPQFSGAESSGARGAPRSASAPWGVLVIDGKPHLVAGTRLYAEGQMLGAARIERITETEVWFREQGRLRKVPHYPSVQRRSLPAQP